MASDQTFIRRTTKNVVAGTVAGIAVCLVGHPFDTLKVRLQTQPINSPIYAGVIDCFYKTLKWEGVSGLYQGVGEYELGHSNENINIWCEMLPHRKCTPQHQSAMTRHFILSAWVMHSIQAALLSLTNPRDALHHANGQILKQSHDHNNAPFVGDMSSCC